MCKPENGLIIYCLLVAMSSSQPARTTGSKDIVEQPGASTAMTMEKQQQPQATLAMRLRGGCCVRYSQRVVFSIPIIIIYALYSRNAAHVAHVALPVNAYSTA